MFSDEEIKEIPEGGFMRPGDEIIRWTIFAYLERNELELGQLDFVCSCFIGNKSLSELSFVYCFQHSRGVLEWKTWQERLGTSLATELK